MADYKDIFKGIVGKVKEVAESDAVRNACDKGANVAKNAVEKVKAATENSAVREFYDKSAAKAKNYARIAKLSLEVSAAADELKNVYAEIGRLYFEQAQDAPEGFYAPLFAQAAELISGKQAKEDEINSLKAEMAAEGTESDIDVEIGDFEEIVNAAEQEIVEPEIPAEPENPQE